MCRVEIFTRFTICRKEKKGTIGENVDALKGIGIPLPPFFSSPASLFPPSFPPWSPLQSHPSPNFSPLSSSLFILTAVSLPAFLYMYFKMATMGEKVVRVAKKKNWKTRKCFLCDTAKY